MVVDIGKALRYFRKSRRLSQRALAGALGITNAHVCNIEKNQANLSLPLLGRINEFFGTDLYLYAKTRNWYAIPADAGEVRQGGEDVR